jgi:hypothetical protein
LTDESAEKEEATTPWSTKIEELNKLLSEEEAKWDMQNISPEHIMIPSFILDCKIATMAEILMDRGIIDNDEFLARLKERTLENLRNARTEVVEPAMRQHRKEEIMQGIANPLMAPSIGKKPRLH